MKNPFKKRFRYVYYKKTDNKFGFQVVGYTLVEKIEMCIDLIIGGVISVKAHTVIADKFSDPEILEKDISSNQKTKII